MTVQLGLETGVRRTRDRTAHAAGPGVGHGLDSAHRREWLEQQTMAGLVEVDDVTAGPTHGSSGDACRRAALASPRGPSDLTTLVGGLRGRVAYPGGPCLARRPRPLVRRVRR